jgi:hypothetical protein
MGPEPTKLIIERPLDLRRLVRVLSFDLAVGVDPGLSGVPCLVAHSLGQGVDPPSVASQPFAERLSPFEQPIEIVAFHCLRSKG